MAHREIILVLNSGSSSVKFALFDFPQESPVCSGVVENLHTPTAQLSWKGVFSGQKILPHAAHEQALAGIVDKIQEIIGQSSIRGVGHRVVHGGSALTQPVVITEPILNQIRSYQSLAPLHNPANVLGIEVLQRLLPDVPQIAVFDTAFHHTLPEKAFTYALPYSLARQHQIRRYGFHGISHEYVTQQAARLLNRPPESMNAIIAHLGNGASVSAIRQGKSVDTSMGMTPLEGLVMGTRCGDIDVGIVPYLMDQLEYSIQEVMTLLQQKSGLLGISEHSYDMRELTAAAGQNNLQAALAIDIFAYRAAKTIASYWVPLQKVDALAFTGGIGENSSLVREKILKELAFLGYKIDAEANKIHGKGFGGRVTLTRTLLALVVPTCEEWMIACAVQAVREEGRTNE